MPSAFSMSPPDSASAARQSSTPAPVLSRSSLTAAAGTLMLCSHPSFISLLMYNTAPLPAARCAQAPGLRLRGDPACGEGKRRALRCREACDCARTPLAGRVNVCKHFLAHCGAGMLANVVGAGMCLPIAGGSSFVMRPHVQASWWQAEQDAGLPGIPRSPAVTRQLGRGWCVRGPAGVGLAPNRTWALL